MTSNVVCRSTHLHDRSVSQPVLSPHICIFRIFTLKQKTNERIFVLLNVLTYIASRKKFIIMEPVEQGLIILMTLLGVVGNFFVLRIYGRRKRKTSTEILIIVLATYDILVCSIPLPIRGLVFLLCENGIYSLLFFVWNTPSVVYVPSIHAYHRCRYTLQLNQESV